MDNRLTIWIGVVMLCGCLSGSAEEKKNDPERMSQAGSGPAYTVTISRDNIRKILVSAALPINNDTLIMSQREFAPLADGYASLFMN